MPQALLPARPLERFCEILDALLADKRWTDGTIGLRYAASSLVTLPGKPAAIAEELRNQAQRLQERARWFSSMKSELRFVVAAMLMYSDLDADAFSDELERIEELFKAEEMKRGTVFSQLAALLLMLDARSHGRSVDRSQVVRYRDLFREMKSHHGFLTSQDDLPACALLSGLAGTPQELAARCERYYEGLRDLGFRRGNALQGVSHILVVGPGDDEVLMHRFRALYTRFDDAGLWMNSGDYDEVAVLSFLPDPAETVVSLVLTHRDHLQSRKPKPGRELAFSLACGTAFLELVRDPADETLRGAQNVLTVQAALQAQQAAMIAAMAGATAAATAAHGS
jgi:hypothetical protein